MAISVLRRRMMQAGLLMPLSTSLFGCVTEKKSASMPPVAFFNSAERLFITAATARLIPEGDDKMGALTAAVPFFIERQLAGPYGKAETWYMQAPFEKGEPEQGYQLAYTPAQLYRTAIDEINLWCRQKFQKPFDKLGTDQQDEILHQLEQGDIQLAKVPGKDFFNMLWQNTQEGFLADPMYGGNYDFTGWKLIGFPGPRYNYVDDIRHYGQLYTLPTVGLLGREGTKILGEKA